MTNLKNHPGYWLRADAAAKFDQAEDEHGILSVSDAGRTEAQQQGLINRWNTGGAANRPPYLYKPAMPASASNHVKDGGKAVDSPDWRKFATYCENYGYRHSYPDGDPVHFDFIGGSNAPAAPDFNQNTLNRQRFLNQTRGAGLVEDGRSGPRTKTAYENYQTYLKTRGWYTGAIDGIWGNGTQAGYVMDLASHTTPPAGHTASVDDLLALPDIRGFQKIARKNGGNTLIDNKNGPQSKLGMVNFLNANYRGSVAGWLRSRWGYKDSDDIWGPNMRAAAVRANAENYAQL